MNINLEIACFNYESAIMATKAGADRIEFCSDIFSGGLTPDLTETKKTIQEVSIPIFVMLRNRADFSINESEISEFKITISDFEKIGVKGFVIGGILNGKLDVVKLKDLVSSSKQPFTLHRAFDHTENLFQTLEDAIEIGFSRILCSGGKGNAIDNIDMLRELNEKAKERIIIMPGGGVRSTNIEKLIDTGCKEFHSSGIVQGEIANIEEIHLLKNKMNS